MDDETVKFLEKMGTGAVEDAMRADALGLKIPFHTIEFLVQGWPIGAGIPGPTLLLAVQRSGIWHTMERDAEQLETRAYKAANQAFHCQPMSVNRNITKNFNPYDWGLNFTQR